MLVREFLGKNKTVYMTQPPYDLAPGDCFLFPKLKTPMKGKRFVTIEEIKEKSKQERVSKVFQGLEKRNAGISVLYLRGGYFEGDKIVID